MSTRELIADFLSAGPYAVVGASTDRAKFGNQVLRSYLQSGRSAFPINPKAEEVEGLTAYPDLASLPEKPRVVSVITPPKVTEKVIEDVAANGITRVWMQPGVESETALRRAEELGLTVISGGPCVLVELGHPTD